MPYKLDNQHAPLISMRVHGWSSNADLERLLSDLAELDTRAEAYAVVLDCTDLRVPDMRTVQSLRRWFVSPSSKTLYRRAVACITTTPMLRGTINAVLRTRPLLAPVRLTDDVDAGRRWALEQLEPAEQIAV